MALLVETLVTGPFVENGYVIWEDGGRECVVIDPGAEPERWMGWLDAHGLTPVALLATHCHLDHVGAVARLEDRYDVPFYIHADEREMLDHLDMQCDLFGHPRLENPKTTRHVTDEEPLRLGGITIRPIATPGHTPGGTSYHIQALGTVFTGDTLFAGTIGRSDLPGGDGPQLIASLRRLCTLLPDETVVRPGHGPDTTIGLERRENPFFRVERANA